MKFHLAGLLFGLLVSCSDQAKVATPSAPIEMPEEVMTDEGAVTCKIFTKPFLNCYVFAQSPADVIRSAERKILIGRPEEPLVHEWRKIIRDDFYEQERGDYGGDMRIVIVLDGDTYAFDAGNRGYVNGKPVFYTPAVEAWAQKYLHPLVGNLTR